MARAFPAVLVQDDPADNMASIVGDGMAEDGTCALVTAMAGGAPRVQCMENPERIVPTALNRGVRAAHGELIICVDGHAVMRPITAGGVWRRWQYAPLLPLACMTLHLGYGLGCLRGLLSWACPGGGAQGARMRPRAAHGQPEPSGALQKRVRHQRCRKPPGRRQAPHTREREHEHTCGASLGPGGVF